ncbi:fumarylacetoacetate hydrolase family protein [Dactylosporangium sp. AC04546]|uniref:2-keto-4-pentenoate hydratase n=1 Tax=Dactylosporangium sp. AC04546 TaxID=2862460 RepID=UPI001EDEB580|nr:fumarylacetoacetate hydrolase family protein [Dactylosporangium sp. AC04546]WVK88808.1 fumarylacetoacetate hydrolase family protein [Dactylosporangium sp. AC04546]
MTDPTLATRLDEATRTARATTQLTSEVPLSLADAYAVQRAGVDLRSRRDDPPVGMKLGFTSRAKAAQMGVFDVIAGVLTAGMRIADGGTVDLPLIHPRIEPELAFLLGDAVHGGDLTTAVVAVAPAVEIIDSRYRNFSFTLEDVVADNASAAAFAIGPWQDFAAARVLDLGNLGVVLEVDGAVVQAGSTAAILGHPLRALDVCTRMVREHGFVLPAGSVILAGAATAAVPLTAGAVVEASVTGLGRVSVRAAS